MPSLLNRIFANPSASTFSLRALKAEQPALAGQFLWGHNRLPDPLADPWMHWGSGSNVLEGFTNIDFVAHPGVVEWDFLDLWPLERGPLFEGAFSEDTLEHFFLAEQQYILCSLNVLLKPGATARLLMPSFTRLGELAPAAVSPGGFLREIFGVTTPVDGINMGLRFSGHRWLHDDESLSLLARECGFRPEKSVCALSREARFNHLNLRNEEDSAAFAFDLVQEVALEPLRIDAVEVSGAALLETLDDGIQVFQAQQDDAEARYVLPSPLPPAALALANIRSANLGEFRDHYYKWLRFVAADGATGEWRLDETVKSQSCMNLVTRQQLRQATAALKDVDQVQFRPASRAGQLFTLGPLELFLAPV